MSEKEPKARKPKPAKRGRTKKGKSGDQTRAPSARSKAVADARRAALKDAIVAGVGSTGRPKTPVAAELGVTSRMLWEWEQADPRFAQALEEARVAGVGYLIDEARRRAVEGIDEPRFHNGERYAVRRYSDTLLMFLIKRDDPSYRDPIASPVAAAMATTVPSGAVVLTAEELDALSTTEREVLRKLAARRNAPVIAGR